MNDQSDGLEPTLAKLTEMLAGRNLSAPSATKFDRVNEYLAGCLGLRPVQTRTYYVSKPGNLGVRFNQPGVARVKPILGFGLLPPTISDVNPWVAAAFALLSQPTSLESVILLSVHNGEVWEVLGTVTKVPHASYLGQWKVLMGSTIYPVKEPLPIRMRDPMSRELDMASDSSDASGDYETTNEGFANEDIGLISKPFDPEKIKVKTEPRSLDLVLKRISHREIDLAPEFQRRPRIWSHAKKAQLIESLLLRIPLPVFYVAAAPNDDWMVVDGLQRLTTISDFAANKFPLADLEYLKHLEGNTFEKLPRALQRRIEETVILIHIVEPGTPEDVMINIFKRINTGGEPLRAQEIRNALVKGPVRPFLRDLASCPSFLDATGHTVSDTRLDAQECVARFCAFSIQAYASYGETDLDSFILSAMKAISAMSEVAREDLKRSFEHSMEGASSILGRYAFRKFFEVDGRRGPVSKALFEATSVNLARLSTYEINGLVARQSDVLNGLVHLMSDAEFLASITASTGDRLRVAQRFSAIEALFSGLLK